MISAQDREITALVNDVREGKLLLPELQRRYVWKSAQVRDLFDSLYRGYPSGQLLVWETHDLPHSRGVSVQSLQDNALRPQLLLDGQQRLTSLSAIMLGQPLIVRGNVRPIDIAFNVHTEKFEVVGPRQRGHPGWVSISKLFTHGPIAVFMELRLDSGSPETAAILERLTRLDRIKNYKYRVNVLEDLTYEEVTRIFIRINSGGTTLSSADLALAQVSSRWRGVTKEFAHFQRDLANRDLDIGPDLLLRAVSVLLTGQSKLTSFFRGDRQQISVDQLEKGWARVKVAMGHAVEFVAQNCHIDRFELLPTKYIFLPLIAFFDRFGDGATAEQIRALQRWVYMALIWSRYSGSTETALDQDVTALGRESAVEGMIRNIEDTVGSRPVSERQLQDQRKNSPLMVMAYVLARQNNAADWFNGVRIAGSQRLELHHIFPKEVLSERYDLKLDSRIVDQVANLAFLSRRANAKTRAMPPSEYLPALEKERLEAQYVPLDSSLYEVERFEDFALERRTLIADAINQLIMRLAGGSALWTMSPVDALERRIDALESRLRTLTSERLLEAYGESDWERHLPKDIRGSIRSRINGRLGRNPYEEGTLGSIEAQLMLCQFSDYGKIIKENFPLFRDVFGSIEVMEQQARTVVSARNAFKHKTTLGRHELPAAEAGLIWFEECLRHVLDMDDSNSLPR